VGTPQAEALDAIIDQVGGRAKLFGDLLRTLLFLNGFDYRLSGQECR
jgi:hypothetical protein